MTKVVIVGEIYEQNLQVGGGPVDPGYGQGHPIGGHPGNRPPGSWSGNYPSGGPVYPGGPTDPGYGRPGWSPTDPGYGQGHPVGGYPGNWVPGSGQYPSGGPVIPPISAPPRPWDPPAGSDIPAPPDEIASEVVIAVWDPTAQTWSVATAPAAQPK